MLQSALRKAIKFLDESRQIVMFHTESAGILVLEYFVHVQIKNLFLVDKSLYRHEKERLIYR